MDVTVKSIFNLENNSSLLSKVDQLDWKSWIWDLKLVMISLAQHKYLKDPYIGVKLLVSSCLSSIMMLTLCIPPYSDWIMRRVFILIMETF